MKRTLTNVLATGTALLAVSSLAGCGRLESEVSSANLDPVPVVEGYGDRGSDESIYAENRDVDYGVKKDESVEAPKIEEVATEKPVEKKDFRDRYTAAQKLMIDEHWKEVGIKYDEVNPEGSEAISEPVGAHWNNRMIWKYWSNPGEYDNDMGKFAIEYNEKEKDKPIVARSVEPYSGPDGFSVVPERIPSGKGERFSSDSYEDFMDGEKEIVRGENKASKKQGGVDGFGVQTGIGLDQYK